MLQNIAQKFTSLSRLHERHRQTTDDRRICNGIRRR